MSFFIREVNGKLVFGGMKSITMDYEYVTPTAPMTLTTDETESFDVKHLWLIGTSVMTHYVKALLRSGDGVYDEDRLATMSSVNGVKILVRLNDQYYLYNNGTRVRNPVEDGKYSWNYGTAEGQVEDAIRGYAPTRWEVESTNL